MAFDLSDEELKATRIINGTASKEELYERIVELEEIEKEHKKENGELRERIKELKSKVKEAIDNGISDAKGWGCEEGAYSVKKEFERMGILEEGDDK
jgi:predicted transcriptional regulator